MKKVLIGIVIILLMGISIFLYIKKDDIKKEYDDIKNKYDELVLKENTKSREKELEYINYNNEIKVHGIGSTFLVYSYKDYLYVAESTPLLYVSDKIFMVDTVDGSKTVYNFDKESKITRLNVKIDSVKKIICHHSMEEESLKDELIIIYKNGGVSYNLIGTSTYPISVVFKDYKIKDVAFEGTGEVSYKLVLETDEMIPVSRTSLIGK